MPWVAADVLARNGLLAIEALRDIVTADLELGRRTAAFPWFTDDLTSSERYALGALRDIASADLELARILAAFPWVVDGVTDDEEKALRALGVISPSDIDLGKRMADTAVVRRRCGRRRGPRSIGRAARRHVRRPRTGKAKSSGLPWLADGAAGGEPDALRALSELASSDLELARLVVGLPWFTDGVDAGEPDALVQLRVTASADPELARLAAWVSLGSPTD